MKPTRASTAISTFRVSRTAISVVWIEVASRCGWLICTPMKRAPAAAAHRPAIAVRRLAVMFMSVSLVFGAERVVRRCPEQ